MDSVAREPAGPLLSFSLCYNYARPSLYLSKAATQTSELFAVCLRLYGYIYYVMQVYRTALTTKSSDDDLKTAVEAARSGRDWLASVLNRPCKRSPRIP